MCIVARPGGVIKGGGVFLWYIILMESGVERRDIRRLLGVSLGEAGAAEPVAGSAVGLFGGSFYPPHGGHIMVAGEGLARLGLDAVWLIPAFANPFKGDIDLPPVADRVREVRAMLPAGGNLFALDWEGRIGVSRTYESVSLLKDALPGVKFVLFAGADILGEIHLWYRWRDLLGMVPLAVFDREPYTGRVMCGSDFIREFGEFRTEDSGEVVDLDPPVWTLVRQPLSDLSGSKLRR
ncbi:MAG: hypothetical protein MPJ79_05695 [Alphaproteobacteria bacterium]|nr:hypothetical protein [Alphaproteobacteria bacterium]MDA7983602.1 hypothetical protein [Alphaproteobacteria bacterium]